MATVENSSSLTADSVPGEEIVLRAPRLTWLRVSVLVSVYVAMVLVVLLARRPTVEMVFPVLAIVLSILGTCRFYSSSIRLDREGITHVVGLGQARTRWFQVGSYQVKAPPQDTHSLWQRFKRWRLPPRLVLFDRYGSRLTTVVLDVGTPEERQEALRYVGRILGEPKP